MRDRAISADEQALALATKRAVQAAGGLEVCARETGLSTSQLSRCCSPHERDSITERDAATIEAIAHGLPGHPHILRTRANMLGFLLIEQPDSVDDAHGLLTGLAEIAAEHGDLARVIADSLRNDSDGGADVTPAEAQRGIDRLRELDHASARLRRSLERIATAGPSN